jgi:hypothetical protein
MENAADRIRRQGRQSQTQTSAHTAMVRRRRAMAMVAALIMGAGYKALRFHGQAKTQRPPGWAAFA